MMEAIDRWWEEKDLGREKICWFDPPLAEMEKLRQRSRWIWRFGRSGSKPKLIMYRLCDSRPQAIYLTSLSMTFPRCYMMAGVSWSRASVKEVGSSVSVSREVRMQQAFSQCDFSIRAYVRSHRRNSLSSPIAH